MIKIVKEFISNYLQNYRLKKTLKEYKVIKNVDLLDESKMQFNQKTHRSKKEKLSIAFIIPGMPRYSGGHTSILRLGTHLSEFGHEIYYVSYITQKISEIKAKVFKRYRTNIKSHQSSTTLRK